MSPHFICCCSFSWLSRQRPTSLWTSDLSFLNDSNLTCSSTTSPGCWHVNSSVVNKNTINDINADTSLAVTAQQPIANRTRSCYNLTVHYYTTPCLKNCTKLFLSEIRQISTNFDNFWQKHGKEDRIMRGALIFHLTYFASSHYRVKRRCSILLGYTTLKVVICNELSNDLISTQ